MKFVPSVLTTTEAHILEEVTASELQLGDPDKEFIGALFDQFEKEYKAKFGDNPCVSYPTMEFVIERSKLDQGLSNLKKLNES